MWCDSNILKNKTLKHILYSSYLFPAFSLMFLKEDETLSENEIKKFYKKYIIQSIFPYFIVLFTISVVNTFNRSNIKTSYESSMDKWKKFQDMQQKEEDEEARDFKQNEFLKKW